MRRAAWLLLAIATPAHAEPHYTSRVGFQLLGVSQSDLGGAHASHGEGFNLGALLATGHAASLSLTLALGLVDLRPGSDGRDGRLANLLGGELRVRIGTEPNDRISFGGEVSDQYLDGRWRASPDDVHHAYTNNLGLGPYVAFNLGAGLRLMVDGQLRGGFLFDHTRLFGDVDGGRWHGAAELELGAGLLGLWGD